MNTPTSPDGIPELARRIAAIGAHGEDRALLLADLEERFTRLAAEQGLAAARRWYWSQAVRGLGGALLPTGELTRRGLHAGLIGDARHALRGLRRRPLYTIGVVGTLALGLASAAAVLSVTWHVWLAPMPFPDPDGVVRLFEVEPIPEGSAAEEGESWRLSPPLLEDLRTLEWTTVRHVAGVSSNVLEWTRGSDITRVQAAVVSPEAFELLGIVPIVGRTLSPDEDRPEVVLTEAFWERGFARDPGVVSGGTMTFGTTEHDVVGVVRLPAGYPRSADVVTRMAFTPSELTTGMRGARYLDVIARVDPAFGPDDVSAELNRFVASLGEVHGNHAGWGGRAVRLGEELLRPYRQAFALLLAAGGIFLLLAVVNVAGLVAARTVDTRRDRAVRLALGASEGRLLRGSLVESVVLGGVAAAAALACAAGLVGPIRALVPAEIPRVENVGLSGGVVVTVAGLAMLCGLVVGLLGYQLSRGAGPSLGRTRTATTPRTAGRSALVVGQVALTVLLATVGAGILRHVASLRGTDLGFEPSAVASTQVMLAGGRYPGKDARLLFWRDLLGELDARGVDAAIGTNPAMAGVNMPWGYRPDPTADQSFAQYHIVSPSYFRIMGIEVTDGRPFTPDDRVDSEPVAIINEALAQRHFGEESAVGRDIHVLQTPRRIVGVVRPVRHTGPSDDAPEEIYVPMEQDAWPHAQILAAGDPGIIGPLVAEALDRLDPTLGVEPIAPYSRFVVEWFASLRLQTIIVGVLALVGVILATLGLYALVAYRVTSRRREIGVRMALGASGSRVFRDVLHQGTFLSLAGVGLGLAIWYASLPLTAELLGEIDARDPVVPLVVGLFVLVVALLASAVPARSSVTVDPSATLRTE